MKHLSLFTGMGMLDLAANAMGFQTIATAEIEAFCQHVLRVRFGSALHFPDVREVRAAGVPVEIDLVSGGFPCQDLSILGEGKGLAGERSGLWREYARVLDEFQPRMAMIENVAVLRGRGLNAILWDLDRHGYDAEWDCLPAAAVGAYHMRDRLWILATRRDLSQVPAGKRSLGPLKAMVGMRVKLPRAGSMMSGALWERVPRATMGDVRKLRAAGRLPYPGVPSDPSHPLWPTPRHASNEWRTTRNAPSHGKTHGATLAGHLNDLEREAGRAPAPSSESAGNISPRYVEWFMGLPEEWTNPDIPNHELVPFRGWKREPLPRTEANAPYRRPRLLALGNGLVPQAASIMLRDLVTNTKGAILDGTHTPQASGYCPAY